MKLLLAVLAVGMLASPASASHGPQAVVDEQVYCGEAAFARVYITREFRWEGRVKIYLGSYRHFAGPCPIAMWSASRTTVAPSGSVSFPRDARACSSRGTIGCSTGNG